MPKSIPDGFNGEVVVFENGQGRGGFDGLTQGGSAYDSWPEVDNEIWVNAEEQQALTVDYLLYNVFKNDPVSSFLLDPVRSIFIPGSEIEVISASAGGDPRGGRDTGGGGGSSSCFIATAASGFPCQR
jgi:hypothetical protein